MSLGSIKGGTLFKRQPKVSQTDWEKLAGPARDHLEDYKLRVVEGKRSFATSGYTLNAQQLARASCVAIRSFYGMDDIKTLDERMELGGALLALFRDLDASAELAYSTPGSPAASRYFECVRNAEEALRVLERRRVARG